MRDVRARAGRIARVAAHAAELVSEAEGSAGCVHRTRGVAQGGSGPRKPEDHERLRGSRRPGRAGGRLRGGAKAGFREDGAERAQLLRSRVRQGQRSDERIRRVLARHRPPRAFGVPEGRGGSRGPERGRSRRRTPGRVRGCRRFGRLAGGRGERGHRARGGVRETQRQAEEERGYHRQGAEADRPGRGGRGWKRGDADAACRQGVRHSEGSIRQSAKVRQDAREGEGAIRVRGA